MKRAIPALLLLPLIIVGCNRKTEKPLDTPVSGAITISADESLRPLVEAEITTFEGIYTNASIRCEYVSEADAIDLLLKDSARLAIVTRRFTDEEREYFKQIRITPTEFDVAISGVAVILHTSNPDTLLTMDEIRSLLRGEINRWDQLGGPSTNGIEIVFDHANSGLVRHLKDSVATIETMPDNVYAASSNTGVIDYVSENPNALGFIGLEWISDKNDSLTNSFLTRVRVAGIAAVPDSGYYQPYQAYLALKKYPLTRRVTVLSREARAGLGRGFLNFFASERGQRIVLKAGLLPVTMPLRIVNVNPANFEVTK